MEAGALFSDDILHFLNEDEDYQLDSLFAAAFQCYEGSVKSASYTTHEPQTSSSPSRITTSPLSEHLPSAPPPQQRDLLNEQAAPPPIPELPTASHSPHCIPNTRFAAPKMDEDILQARKDGRPKTTQKDTKYCVSIWDDWRTHRESLTAVQIPSLLDMSNTELTHWLTRFVLEVRKKNGDLYPPNSLYHICAGLQRHLRWNGRQLDIFSGTDFANFQATLDAELKSIASKGVGSKKRQAEVILEEEEQLLWNKGLLGEDHPQQLLDTIIFYNGLYFALRSGREHRQLRHSPCQIELVERDGQRSYLVYREDISKNRPGGLRGRNIQPKVVYHHANLDNSQHCFVRLFKKY